MRGESELSTRRSRVQRLHRQSAVFAVCRVVTLSIGRTQGNPCASRASPEYDVFVSIPAGMTTTDSPSP